MFHHGEFVSERLAKAIGYSPGNLHGRLKAIDRSFAQILDQMPAQTTKYDLWDPSLPVDVVAGIV